MTRVLLVDDELLAREILRDYLSSDPTIDVVGEASDGRIAVVQAASLRPDVILMDMQMPVMDGLSATKAIREFEVEAGRPRTPLLMATAHALPEHIQAAKTAGADGHLTKPLAAKEVLAALDALASRPDEARSAAA